VLFGTPMGYAVIVLLKRRILTERAHG
jgi:hypothetical protein